MKFFSSACSAIILTAIICLGCSKQQAEWKLFISQAGGYSALFPGQPKERVMNERLKVVHIATYEEDNKRAAYMVVYADIGEQSPKKDVDKYYDDARNGIIAKSGNRLLTEKAVELGGISGREMEVSAEKGANFCVVRVFLVKDRLYQAIVVEPTENRASSNILYFLNSFQLSDAK